MNDIHLQRIVVPHYICTCHQETTYYSRGQALPVARLNSTVLCDGPGKLKHTTRWLCSVSRQAMPRRLWQLQALLQQHVVHNQNPVFLDINVQAGRCPPDKEHE
jgi:hypothetical protein